MTAATDLATRTFGERDFAAGARLIEQARWNQVEADWRAFVVRGKAYAVESPRAGVIATAATLPYDGVAWVSMVLVDVAWRRRGIARMLIDRCTREIAASGRIPVLDATPAGRTVYAGMEYRDVWVMQRWARGAGVAGIASPPGVRAMHADDLDAVTALDARAFGASRGWLVASLAARGGAFATVVEHDGEVRAALLGRTGRVATQLGPLVGDDEDDSIALLEHAVARISGPIYLDVPERHGTLNAALVRLGFTVQRPFTRMAWRTDRIPGNPSRYFAAAGPELG